MAATAYPIMYCRAGRDIRRADDATVKNSPNFALSNGGFYMAAQAIR